MAQINRPSLISQKAVKPLLTTADLVSLDKADLVSLVTRTKGVIATPKATELLRSKQILELSIADIGFVLAHIQTKTEGGFLDAANFLDKALAQGGNVLWEMKEETMPSGQKQDYLVAKVNIPNKPITYFYNAPMMCNSRPRAQYQMIATFICCTYSIKKGEWVMLLQDSELKLKNFLSIKREGVRAFVAVLESWFKPKPNVTLSGADFNVWFFTELALLDDLQFFELSSHFIVNVLNAGSLSPNGSYTSPPNVLQPYKVAPIIPAIAITNQYKATRQPDDRLDSSMDPLRAWIGPLSGAHHVTSELKVDTGIAFQSYVSGSRFRGGQKTGIHFFLNTVGTCGIPTKRQYRLQVALSLILALEKDALVDVRGMKAEEIRFVEAARVHFGRVGTGLRYVVDQSIMHDRTVADTKKITDTRPNRAFSIFFQKTQMEQTVKIQEDGQSSKQVLLTKHVDAMMEAEFSSYSGNFMVVGCSLLPTGSALRAFKIRMPFDAYGIFSNMTNVYRVGSVDGIALGALEDLTMYDPGQWSTQVVAANNAANAFFLTPAVGKVVRFANLVVPVKTVISYNLSEAAYSNEVAMPFDPADLYTRKPPEGMSASSSSSVKRNVAVTLANVAAANNGPPALLPYIHPAPVPAPPAPAVPNNPGPVYAMGGLFDAQPLVVRPVDEIAPPDVNGVADLFD